MKFVLSTIVLSFLIGHSLSYATPEPICNELRIKLLALPQPEVATQLYSVLSDHFSAIGGWDDAFRIASRNSEYGPFYRIAEQKLLSASQADLTKLSPRARQILTGIQSLVDLYGEEAVRSRILGFLVVQSARKEYPLFGNRSPIQGHIDFLKVDILRSESGDSFPGFGLAARMMEEKRGYAKGSPARSRIFGDAKGLGRYFIEPIDGTARSVAPGASREEPK